MKLLNPSKTPSETSKFFEKRGKKKLKEADHERVWYADFLEFQKEQKLFASLMTPEGYGSLGAKWNTWKNCEFNEVLGFFGLGYWYTWQVSMLGLGPIWMGKNEAVKKQTAKLLEDGGIFAFGLSEKEHGADLYASEMTLTPSGSSYKANGRKYYIGNANKASLVSVFGKLSTTGEFVFFVVDSQHPNYKCVQNVVNSQNYVAEFELRDYPLEEKDILARGQDAWDAALNTINVCKFNLGWAAIGSCTHSFYEAMNHAATRRLFDHYVTDFPHIQQIFVDAYSRLIAMKLFAGRASDYMRSASKDDRRYLLFNPMVKMKVTTQGEEVINLLWDVIAAKGFEKNMYFETAAREIRGLPKLEGTVHVNMALIMKFMPNYFFKPGNFPEIPKRDDGRNDSFLFEQGLTKGLGKIQFHDYRLAYEDDAVKHLPNIKIFREQIKGFKRLLMLAKPNKEQIKDFDFLLILGEMFTLVAYGQLIIENAKIEKLEDDQLEQIFDFMIRDFSKFALQLYSKTSSTRLQMLLAKMLIRKPVQDRPRFERVWNSHVHALAGTYTMPE